MRVLMMAPGQDFANVGFEFAKALNAVGIESRAITSTPHPFYYPEHAEIPTSDDLVVGYINESDAVLLMHSLWPGISLGGKRIDVFHGGTHYRQFHKSLNDVFNPVVTKSLIQTADLLGLGAKNEVWIMPPVNLDLLKPDYSPCRPDGKLQVGHFPSSGAKGSYSILESLRKLKKLYPGKFEYMVDANTVTWKDNIERMRKCDIIIDAVSPYQGSKKYGEWGVTALEAAAMGKLVFSHFGASDLYEVEFGDPWIYGCNNIEELESKLGPILQAGHTQDCGCAKYATRRWVETLHSYEAVGNRMRKLVYEL